MPGDRCPVAVPPRRRRSGYRPGQLSPEVREAISAEAANLSELGDPLAIIAAVGDTFAALDDALAEIALPRLRAIAQLRRQGWSYDRLAAATDLSKGRVAQLAREAQQRGL
jgi:DNA-directed RNA polymerase specialized sigma24 family protein